MALHRQHSVRAPHFSRLNLDCKQRKELQTTKLFAAVCACMGIGSVAYGQQQIPGSQAPLEEIVITGSRIVRRDLNAPSPILTVDTEVFEQNSSISIEAVLNQYPQFNPGATQFTASDIQPTAQNTPGASTLNMRNLGPGRSLVLLDGRRAQPVNSAMTVDVNTLPAAAIRNVEVISGGAAATYGPDAMAGVVNFRLRRDFEGVELNYQLGGTEVGDGEETRIDALIGFNDSAGRGNAMFSVGYGSREVAYQNTRDFFRQRLHDNGTGANYIFVDFPAYIPAANNLPSQAAVDLVMPNPGAALGGAFYVNPATGSIFRLGNAIANGYDGPTTAPYLIREHNGNLEQNMIENWLSSPMTRTSLFGRAFYELTDNVTVFVQGSHNQSSVSQRLAPTSASATAATLPRNPALEPENLRILLDSRTTPGAPWTMQRLPNYMPFRGATSDTEVSEFVVGLEGEIGSTDWTWEAYHQNGRTNLLTRMENFIWVDRLRTVLAQPNYGRGASFTVAAANDPVSRTYTCTSGIPVFEPWTFSLYGGEMTYQNGFELSADCIEAITAEMTQRNVIEQRVTEANFQGKLAEMRAGELRGAFGISNRTNYSLFEPDPLFVATQGAEGETEVSEIYGEVLVPVFGSFELEVGGRYSDFKTGDWNLDAKSYKALFNWAATESYRFRGGWQRANRVPNVAELYAGISSSVFGWGGTSDVCMTNTTLAWGNQPNNPNRAQVQELCRQLIYASGGIPGQNDFDIQGANFYPSDGRALPHSYRLLAGGNPRLEAENADTWTLGLVWQARDRDMTISADWYEIEIDNVVGSLGFLAAYQQCFNANGTSNPSYDPSNAYCQRITRDPLNAEPLIVYGGNFNFSQRLTSGVDLSFAWSAPLANFGLDMPGEIGVRSAANKLLTWKQPQFQEPDSPLIEYAGYGVDFDYQLFTTFFYNRERLNVGLNWRHMSEQIAQARAATPEATTLPTSSYNLFNLNGSWRFTDKLRLRGGIDNLFDTSPPLTGRNPDAPGNPSNGTGITNAANYDTLGRRYFVGVAVTF